MKHHVLFDRTERLFSAGQRALERLDFPGAVDLLQRAAETDADYPQIYRYLAIAHAEMDRFDAAVELLQKAIRLDPSNFVFRMDLGVVYLDAGDADAAAAHFGEAARLAPKNALVKTYAALAAFDLGGSPTAPTTIRELPDRSRDLPSSFHARLILRAEERRLTTGGPSACVTPPGESSTTGPEPHRFAAVTRWRARRRLNKARRHLDAGSVEAAVACLSQTPVWAIDHNARGVWQEAVGKLHSAGASSVLSRTRRAERRKRRLFATVASFEFDLGNSSGTYRALKRWIESFDASGMPPREAITAANLLVWMAEIDVNRAEFKSAAALCERARQLGSFARLEWVDAVARLGAGDKRAARQRFERFLRLSIAALDSRLEVLAPAAT